MSEPTYNIFDAFQFDSFQFDSFQMDGGQNYETKYGKRATTKPKSKDRKKMMKNLLYVIASIEEEL